jgi:glucosamine kinase
LCIQCCVYKERYSTSLGPGAFTGMMTGRIGAQADMLLLGVDGGGTRCRARLVDAGGTTLGEGIAGPANIRFGLEESLSAVRKCADQCLRQAGASYRDQRIVACLALAGACEPTALTQARASLQPFHRTIFTSDARAACMGAHAGQDGGIIIIGTGSVGWGIVGPREYRVGGWGFPVSDEGSGAWLGCEGLRRALWARDGLIPWTGLLQTLFERFESDGHAIVRWMNSARPRDFAILAPSIVAQAQQGDAMARELMGLAAHHIDAIAARLSALGVARLSLMGGLAEKIAPYLSDQTRGSLVPAKGDALNGALDLARAEADRIHPVMASEDG